MLIEIHMLKNYGPANLNRDDTNAPRDMYVWRSPASENFQSVPEKRAGEHPSYSGKKLAAACLVSGTEKAAGFGRRRAYSPGTLGQRDRRR